MTPRRIGAVLALVAAAMLLVGTFTRRWIALEEDTGGLGLLGIELCGEFARELGADRSDHACRSGDWDDLLRGVKNERVDQLKQAALAAFAGSLLAAAVFALVGVLGLATRKSLSLVTILSTIGAILALVGAIAVVLALRRYIHEENAPGYSFYVYAAGCVVGAIGSLVSRAGGGYATPRG